MWRETWRETMTTQNRILPAGSQFQAIVNGKPTGLAGCKQSVGCPFAGECLRADERLAYRADFTPVITSRCAAFFPNH